MWLKYRASAFTTGAAACPVGSVLAGLFEQDIVPFGSGTLVPEDSC
jgi:hypothetical protein